MKKLLILSLFFSLLVLAFASGSVLAKPSDNQKHPTFSLPESAVKVSDDVYYLGKANYHGKLVEGYAYIRRADNRNGNAKPGSCGNGICDPGENANKCAQDCSGGGGGGDTGSSTSSCYGFMASGAKWKSVENWVVNTTNNSGMSSNSVFDTMVDAVSTWEDAADGAVDNIQGFDILGSASTTNNQLVADTDSPDDKNEVYFADISSANSIGVTIVWGVFRGPSFWRELVEWDQIYDDVDFDWSADCTTNDCTTKMDFPNISIHELGHSVGLDDLYDSTCADATMYGYASEGDINKRDLIDGDVNGVTNLYN